MTSARMASSESGFTLTELLVVVGLIAVLFVLSTINLGKAQTSVSVTTVTNTLLADLKNQQLLAMVGDDGSTSSQQEHGVYIQSNSYTLFADSSYNPSDSNNFNVSAGNNSLTTTFPSNQVVFNKGDGSVDGFSTGHNTITISGSGTTKIITINRFGATSVQ